MTGNKTGLSELPYRLAKELLENEFNIIKEEFNHMDMWGINLHTNHTCEIEIKNNDYDFYKEFTKPCKQQKHIYYNRCSFTVEGYCPTRYYFMVPHNFGGRALSRITMAKNPWYKNYGLITFNRDTETCQVIKKSEILTDKTFNGELPMFPWRDFRHKRIICE